MTRFVPTVAMVLLLGGLSVRAAAQTEPDAQAVRQERSAHRRRIGLYVAGSALFVAWWGSNALAAGWAGSRSVSTTGFPVLPNRWEPEWDTFRGLGFVPLLGPWMQLATIPSSATEPDGWAGWLVLSGLTQALGVTLFALAATMDVPILPNLALSPSLRADGGGLMALGVF